MSKSRRPIKTKRKQTGKIYIACIVLFLIMVMSIQMIRLYQKNQEYRIKEQALAAELEEQEKEQEDLKEFEAYTKTKEYVEDTAKSKLGLAYSDEIIFREE